MKPAIPEPIEFVNDRGDWRFGTECQPLRTVINPIGIGVPAIVDHGKATVEITLHGKTVIYDRVGYDIAGNWICDLRIGQKRGIEG